MVHHGCESGTVAHTHDAARRRLRIEGRVNAIIKRPKTAEELREERIASMWALFLLQNANPKPALDGSFFLGDISNPAEKNWTKMTPYSLARPKDDL
jgi:hypothetical protein